MPRSNSDSTKKFVCPEEGCNSSFTKNSRLVIHSRKHTGERPFVCDVESCDKTYTCKAHLKRHKDTAHNDNRPSTQVQCTFEGCEAFFSNKYSLKNHYKRNHEPNGYPFECSECSQGFHRKRQLQQHSYLHTGEPAFLCDKCPKAFALYKDLKKHQRSHKTYTCECEEIFYRWSDLLAHRKICKKQKPKYICHDCGKHFNHKGNFKQHTLKHSKEGRRTVFRCPYKKCKRFYLYEKNCVFHIKHYHKKVPKAKRVCCTFSTCTASFDTKQHFLQHYKTHFRWAQKKKIRKTRKDKGKKRKCLAADLSGVQVPKEILDKEEQEKNKDKEEDEDSDWVPEEDKKLMSRCDKVLKTLRQLVY